VLTTCRRAPSLLTERFAKYGVENSEENRRAYRQMLFEAPGASQFLCAAILDPETLYQRSTSAGKPLFPERLKQLGELMADARSGAVLC
jgi:fructose-bisphosphate aldolase class I